MNRIKTFKYKTNAETSQSNGFLNKISKRYSTISSKIIKRQSPGRKENSPPKVIAGSYDMTGSFSEDHRLEIGAPVLISTTTLDTDIYDKLNDIQPIRVSSVYDKLSDGKPVPVPSNPASSGSETEVFADAVSFQDIRFQFGPRTPNGKDSSPESNKTSHSNSSTTNDSLYETPKIRKYDESLNLKNRYSKSVQNLHKSELKFVLQKAPSMEIHNRVSSHHYHEPEVCHSPEPVYQQPTSKSAPNTPMAADPLALSTQQYYNSVDSLNVPVKANGKQFASTASVNRSSKTSLAFASSVEDFDLKSVSCHSLNAQNLFLSIEELDEITQQINESEEFANPSMDLDYCNHRDNLKPNERRITLLKNKNSSRINHAWSELKHWLGEEGTKIKEVMHKQAALQRVGARIEDLALSKENLSPNVREMSIMEISFEGPASSDHFANSMISLNKSSVEDQVDLSEVVLRNGEISPCPTSKPEVFEGQNGFEELRRYIKQGGDFGKELIAILQERVESEQLYAKSLSKMANKLNKACRELPGSIADAWRGVATEMESRSDVHRQFSSSLVDEIVKPLKTIAENHHKARKTVEANVDKSARVLTEWRISESKAKKMSHSTSRDNEKLQDAMLDVRIQKSPSIAMLQQSANKNAAEKEIKIAEKDCAKLDNKRRKAEESVKRADVEYYTLCLRAERARVDWEMSVLRGSTLLQNLETQRLNNMKTFASNYLRLTANINPVLDGLVQRLTPVMELCNVQKDLNVIKNIRRSSEGPSEQLLPDFYCEHTTLAMNRERRKHALVKLLQLVKTDLERERRSRNGLKGLSQSMNNQDNQSITDKLYHIRSMLTYLEGARFKLHSALLELDHKPRTTHPLAAHIQITRDRTGLQQSILKVPIWLKNNDKQIQSADEGFDNAYDNLSQANSSCIDLKHDSLLHKMDLNFTKSKTSLDMIDSERQRHSIEKSSTMVSVKEGDRSPEFDRGIADGGSNQPDSDFDEFSSQDGDGDDEENIPLPVKELSGSDESTANFTPNGKTKTSVVISRCKALYSYSPKLYDELELSPGDIIEVHAKQEDGWWLGELKNRIGIFPATYVEEYF